MDISITKGSKLNKIFIYSTLDFFKQDSIIVKVFENKIKFIRPSIGYLGKTYKPNKVGNTGRQLQIVANIPFGRYELSEESNEDELIINF